MSELEEFARKLTTKCNDQNKWELIRAARDREMWEEINRLIESDTNISSPEISAYTDCPHWDKGMKNAVEVGNLVTRYYYDNVNGARAYGLIPYDMGVAIIARKGQFGVFMLNEDDGSWFLFKPLWITNKSNFIACLSAALSIFNENYKV